MSIATLALRSGASLISPAGSRGRLVILMYHRVLPDPDPLTGETDAATFDVHMRALRECFNVLPLAEAAARLSTGTLPARAAAITFDDGYRDNVKVALPILLRHDLHATFFIADGFLNGGRMFNDSVIEAIRRVPGPTLDIPAANLSRVPVGTLAEKSAAIDRVLDAVKYLSFEQRMVAVDQVAQRVQAPLPDDLMMSSEEVGELIKAGMEVGGHTVNHPILTKIDVTRARQEIRANRATLEEIVGHPLRLFAYPNGVPNKDYAAEHVALVREAGYQAAVTTSRGAAERNCDRFQLPRFTPWDRDPRRFVGRLLHNALTARPVVINSMQPAVLPV